MKDRTDPIETSLPQLTRRAARPYRGNVTAWRARLAAGLLAGLCVACSSAPEAERSKGPRLPEGKAGRVLARALEAAGGWDRWMARRDVSFVSTLNVIDRARQISSESIGWYKAPLHAGAKARMDSIGLPSSVTFGIDGGETWIYSDGEPVVDGDQLALTRFEMVSNLFWFSLPFAAAEIPATVTALPPVDDADGHWERLKIAFEEPNPMAPGPWFVLYLDHDTALIDHVYAQLEAPFLRQRLWVGKWLRYRDCEGFAKERQRQFFPADMDGRIIGPMVAEQFVEHVRFDNGYPASYFERPRAEAARQPPGPTLSPAPMDESHPPVI
jgi:hypothetical protein